MLLRAPERGAQEKSAGNVDNKVFNTILDLSGLRGENEECLHLLTPHFAHGHEMSFGIKCLCAIAVKSSPNHQKKSANVSKQARSIAHCRL